MRKLMILAAPVLLASPAMAQTSDVTGNVYIDGSVAGRCLFTLPSANLPLGELALSGDVSTAGKLDVSKVNGQDAELTGWCNHTAATMTVEALPLTNLASAGASGNFTNRIDYTATALANSQSATDGSADPAVGSPVNVGMFAGTVLVTLSGSTANNKLLVAGNYNGTVKVTLAPNFVVESSSPD